MNTFSKHRRNCFILLNLRRSTHSKKSRSNVKRLGQKKTTRNLAPFLYKTMFAHKFKSSALLLEIRPT